MTQLDFRYRSKTYRAEVLLDHDLHLEEILDLGVLSESGAVLTVSDPLEFEPVIESEIEKRAGELRERRDAARRRMCESMVRHPRPLTERAPSPTQKTVAPLPPSVIQCEASVGDIPSVPSAHTTTAKEAHIMQFSLKHVNTKTGRLSYKSNTAPLVVKFAKSSFEGEAPATIEIDAPFKVKVAKVRMTREERKAFNAANPRPKKTAAEKLALLEKRQAKLKAAIEAGL